MSTRQPARECLPNRRPSMTFSFEAGGLHGSATISWFADGNVAEVFLAAQKAGSQADNSCRDAAVAASLALQFGCPLDLLRNALLRDVQGKAATPLCAVLDLIAEQEDLKVGAAP
jgi:ribonucleoside-diphosphate reductase alpha chain